MKRHALLSNCGKYRYWLSRTFEPATGKNFHSPVLFIMLNPSTADALLDDPTIRRCISFAKRWGHLGVTVANLYAYRATDPKDLWKTEHPEGIKNDLWLQRLINDHAFVVCAWGVNAEVSRVERFKRLAFSINTNLWCLGTTKNGSPKHPLYIKADQELEQWGNDIT